jgi:hypothetical protein
LSALAQTYIGNISRRVRFSPKKTLENLATRAYRTHDTLKNLYEEHKPFRVHTQLRQILYGVDVDRIGEIASRLETYSASDQQFVESLSQFAALETEAVNELVEAAEMVDRELEPTTDQEQMQIMVADMRMSGSEAFQRIRRILDEWAEPTEMGSGKRFKEVSTHYAE